MSGEFATAELAYLLGLAGARRRKRERDVPKIKAGQNPEDFERAYERWKTSLAWAWKIEDKLILLVAARDRSLLRPSASDRALELLPNQTRYLRCPDCGHIWEPIDPCPGCGMPVSDIDDARAFTRSQRA